MSEKAYESSKVIDIELIEGFEATMPNVSSS